MGPKPLVIYKTTTFDQFASEYLDKFENRILDIDGYRGFLVQQKNWVAYLKPYKRYNTKLVLSDEASHLLRANLSTIRDANLIIDSIVGWLNTEGFSHQSIEEMNEKFGPQLELHKADVPAFAAAAADAIGFLRAMRKAQSETPVDFTKDPEAAAKQAAKDRKAAEANLKVVEAKKKVADVKPNAEAKQEAEEINQSKVEVTPNNIKPEAKVVEAPAKAKKQNRNNKGSEPDVKPAGKMADKKPDGKEAPMITPSNSDNDQPVQGFGSPVVNKEELVVNQINNMAALFGLSVQEFIARCRGPKQNYDSPANQMNQRVLSPTPFNLDVQPHPTQAQRYEPEHQFRPAAPQSSNTEYQPVSVVNNYTNSVYIPLTDLPEFDGKSDDVYMNEQWLEDFSELAEKNGWTERRKCNNFSKRLIGLALKWYKSLSSIERTNWEDLEAVFLEEFCNRRNEADRGVKYYNATQQSDESALEFLWRLSKLVPRELRIRDNKDHYYSHLNMYVSRLTDANFSSRVYDRNPKNLTELKNVVKDLERTAKLRVNLARRNRPSRDATSTHKIADKGIVGKNKPVVDGRKIGGVTQHGNKTMRRRAEVNYTNDGDEPFFEDEGVDHEDHPDDEEDGYAEEFEQGDEEADEAGCYEIQSNQTKSNQNYTNRRYRSPPPPNYVCARCKQTKNHCKCYVRRCVLCSKVHRDDDECPIVTALKLIAEEKLNGRTVQTGGQSTTSQQPLN